MKPKPLKGKTQSHCHKRDLTDRHDIHDDADIKSAIEWLKEKLTDDWYKNEGKHNYSKVNSRINEAFEDVK